MESEEKINILMEHFLQEMNHVSEIRHLETLRIKYLGRKGLLTAHLRSLGSLPQQERPQVGRKINQAKEKMLSLLADKREAIKKASVEDEIRIDVTLPGRPFLLGRKHPITQIREEIEKIFTSMGFQIQEGPDVETDYYNFEALNIPPEHPARDVWDTLYLKTGDKKTKGEFLLRTHTSPVQIRVMEKHSPPLAVIAPGRCYRRDAADSSHSPVFHQVEGFLVDRGIAFSDLKGILVIFVHRMFSSETRLRFRPSFFPFTEPSAEVDIECFVCHGEGCSLCKHSGWLEILGAGMIDPEVFRYVGYGKEYTGFAFGMGVERIALLKYGIDDMRLFYENDLRFLRQF